ncbi:B27 [miniopterid betaherpesvirus 1]|uniref:B27 n=1 Tax=miniopterid betaherpesvirus 1 TaxID=3070189 RepID=I3VPZ5_9BETA|nr:B27 [miniopterid betaherpesvirus 1]AFK83839.1 B27 [miniopterid betaherpesvirus 1]
MSLELACFNVAIVREVESSDDDRSDCLRSLYDNENVIYRFVGDVRVDWFSYKFMTTHLVSVRTFEEAVAHGLITGFRRVHPGADLSAEPGGGEDGGAVYAMRRQPIVKLRQTYFDNARLATCHGKYNVRGMSLEWDTAVWGLLKRACSSDAENPFALPGAAKFRSLVCGASFRPDTCPIVQRLAVAVASGQYAVNTLLNYRNKSSVAYYIKYLSKKIMFCYRELKERSAGLTDKLSRLAAGGMMPLPVCRKSGLGQNYRSKAYLLDPEFVAESFRSLQFVYRYLCGCGGCCYTNSLAWMYPNVPLEANHVLFNRCAEMGPIWLPPIRHLTAEQRIEMCRMFSEDLCLSVWRSGEVEDTDVFPCTAPESLDPVKWSVIHLSESICSILSVLKALSSVLSTELNAYATYLQEDVNVIGDMLWDKGYGLSQAVARDPSQAGRFNRYDGLPDMFRGLRFGSDAVSFFDAVCCLLECANVVPEYDALPEYSAREELLLHNFFIRRIYTEMPDETRLAEPYLVHCLRHGDFLPQDAVSLRSLRLELSNAELCNSRMHKGFWEPLPGPSKDPSVFCGELRYFSKLDGIHVRAFRPGFAWPRIKEDPFDRVLLSKYGIWSCSVIAEAELEAEAEKELEG